MEQQITRQSLYFTDTRQVEVREEPVHKPGVRQLLVQSLVSAISSGTEQLVYKNQIPADMPLDETIAALNGTFQYPFKYGYANVGKVIEVGEDISSNWKNQLVFAFHPHESPFLTTPEAVLLLPDGVSPRNAAFLPNMETAVNLVMDGRPIIGERVLVFGQGIVGLLTTALLAQFPVGYLVTIDQHPNRREASTSLGCDKSVSPDEADQLAEQFDDGFDLIFELSGNPAALDQAISFAGFDSRIVVGSWYGTKPARLNLGSNFHRKRIRLTSSQVSTVAPALQGRWTKSRRMQLTWQILQQINPAQFITHEFPINQADQAYQLLDEAPGDAIQLVLTYP